MKRHIISLFAGAFVIAAAPAIAQEGTAAGVAGGAAAGAAIGGPVGAVVGGAAGAMLGTAIDPPPEEVRSYVVQEQVPSVTVEREIVVGEPLPDTVTLHTVPEYKTYSYAVVNDRRVIVDAETRQVVEVID